MTEAEMRLHRCCFTGHRPEKLHVPETEVKALLEKAIRQAVEDGYTTFISGMARGVDMWAAEIVLRLRANNPLLHLIAAVPYEGFEQRWSKQWQDQYKFILECADLVKYICNGYSMATFQIRNEWMVNHSARIIAFFNGEKGGTKNTIDYTIDAAVLFSFPEEDLMIIEQDWKTIIEKIKSGKIVFMLVKQKCARAVKLFIDEYMNIHQTGSAPYGMKSLFLQAKITH